jgi:hypothetical protein
MDSRVLSVAAVLLVTGCIQVESRTASTAPDETVEHAVRFERPINEEGPAFLSRFCNNAERFDCTTKVELGAANVLCDTRHIVVFTKEKRAHVRCEQMTPSACEALYDHIVAEP